MPLKSTEEWDRSEKLSIPGQSSPDFAASHLDRVRQLRVKALAHLVRQALRRLEQCSRVQVLSSVPGV
jgi:hypothetical protein